MLRSKTDAVIELWDVDNVHVGLLSGAGTRAVLHGWQTGIILGHDAT